MMSVGIPGKMGGGLPRDDKSTWRTQETEGKCSWGTSRLHGAWALG